MGSTSVHAVENRDRGDQALLRVRDLKKHFLMNRTSLFQPREKVFAVDGVSFDVWSGETLGIVGESGCGKSTIARAILHLIEPTSGQVLFKGQNVTSLKGAARKKLRAEMQIIFQDPYSSLNPRLNVATIVGDSLKTHGLAKGGEVKDRVIDILGKVGIRPERMTAYPHEFSGGQRQRIGIARALILEPKLVICDEPVSALDVSIQAQVLNLLVDLKDAFNLSYIMITHDLSVVNYICNRVAVVYLGRMIEIGPKGSVLGNPQHPYTRTLISAVPILDPRTKKKKIVLTGEIPSPISPPSGCHFHTRCPDAMEICKRQVPAWTETGAGHSVACHLYASSTAEN